MAFWKKSEDPWDIDPAKEQEKQDREPLENPLDALRDWNEERKARAAAKQAEWEAQPKEMCPWCGKEMERGCLAGSRGVYWFPGRYTAWWGPSVIEDSLRVDNEGGLSTYKTAWYCRSCKKMLFSMAAEISETLPPQTGEACAAEPERYAEDAGECDADR